jgi:hypothetical protein
MADRCGFGFLGISRIPFVIPKGFLVIPKGFLVIPKGFLEIPKGSQTIAGGRAKRRPPEKHDKNL